MENASWIYENSLALYAAIVGTLALLFNFIRFRHTVTKTKPRIRVQCSKSPEYDRKIRDLKEDEGDGFGGGMSITDVYSVTVRNIGDVDINIRDVWIITDKGQKISALVYADPTSLILDKINERNTSSISPKNSKCFSVYLKKDENPFEVKQAFVRDALGKEWKCGRIS